MSKIPAYLPDFCAVLHAWEKIVQANAQLNSLGLACVRPSASHPQNTIDSDRWRSGAEYVRLAHVRTSKRLDIPDMKG